MPPASHLKLLLVSFDPPQDDCGIRVVLHRHLVQRNPFEFKVVTNADFFTDGPTGTKLRLPFPLHRLKKSRFGPKLHSWLIDYETQVWPLCTPRRFDNAVRCFRPDVILALADNCLSSFALRTARKYNIPLAGLFLDWFPIMKWHYGHSWSKNRLSNRFRQFYHECDLAFCTSDGMRETLGTHPNSHVIYPMPGLHRIPETVFPAKSPKFRLVYVGSIENFYGRMICSLIERLESFPDIEILVIGPNPDWPADLMQRAKASGIYLGFKPPEEAAAVLAGADALLVVMSFEKEYEVFMRTSFTTKFLDYAAFGKPVILWGPEYCTPVQVVRKHGGAEMVNDMDAKAVFDACRRIAENPTIRRRLSEEAKTLHQGLFNADRLQGIFVKEIERLAKSFQKR